MKRLKEKYATITDKLVSCGLRPTRQRILLGSLLFTDQCRHVTAEMLHRESKDANINVSLATVYNTLHQFTDAGLLREVAVEDGRSYFDTNTTPHHHFLNEETGALMDIPAEQIHVGSLPNVPEGMIMSGVDIVIRIKPAATMPRFAH